MAPLEGTFMKKRVLVMGADGFIGRNVSDYLSISGRYEVFRVDIKECDLLSTASVRKTMNAITGSFALVFCSAITRLVQNDNDSMQRNINMAQNIAESLTPGLVSQVIFLSTVDVYGLLRDGSLLSETMPTDPSDSYSKSKLVSEGILKSSCSAKKIPLAVLRLSGVYGPNDAGRSTVGVLLRNALRGEIILDNGGKIKRDYVYVTDICRIVELICESEADMLVNVATGNSLTVSDIAAIIKANIDRKVTISSKETENGRERAANMVYDISRFRNAFPGFDFTSLEDGIRQYCRFQSLRTENSAGKDN